MCVCVFANLFIFICVCVCVCVCVCEPVVRRPVEARWHAYCLSSNAATVLQRLIMVLQSLAVCDTMLCASDCRGMVSGGMKLGFCICVWVDGSSVS